MTDLEMTPTQPASEKGSDFLSRPLLATINIDWEKAIYIAFILIALVTRLWGLGDRVMSHDESLHTQFSYQFFRGDGFRHTPLMHGPFLFHITALSYWLFGDSDLSARVPVALFGVILVAIPYFLRSWIGRVGALFTAFIFLISPYIVYYSRYIRHDIYVIVFALIVFIASWHFLDKKKEKYLWWFAAGLSLMFATKEVAFIYVAIFGSFLILRLLPQIFHAEWFPGVRRQLTTPLLVVGVGILLLGGGFVGQQMFAETAVSETTETTEPFAADPETDTAVDDVTGVMSSSEFVMRWAAVAGVFVAALGLFLMARTMRSGLDQLPEFDLVILYSTLILPLASPLLITMAGWNPRDYTFTNCLLDGQETLSPLQLVLARIVSSSWWGCTVQSGFVRIGFFLIITLAISILVGLWWNRRRWGIAAAIFYSIFIVLYTSVFTNPGGVTTGLVGSLGYWLEQQEVQRGSQPTFYYLFVVPFYEFLPLIFSTLAIFFWLKIQRLNQVVGYWLLLGIVAFVSFSLTNWWFNNNAAVAGAESDSFVGLLVAGLIGGVGILYWFLFRRRQIKASTQPESGSLLGLLKWESLIGFVPNVIWWLALTWAAYSYAGEKMPWLSTHFVIPMAILSGWYMNEKLARYDAKQLFSSNALLYMGLSIATLIAFLLAFGPIFLGVIEPGNQQLENLSRIGRIIGAVAAVVILVWLWRRVRLRIPDGRLRNALLTLSIFAILAALTIRFAYMASFPNADYAREYLVYAHGAPAAKDVVLEQIDELSLRLYGDNSLSVGFGGSGVSWPFTWYMREYPNSVYYGENPDANLQDSPAVIVGRSSWDQVDSLLGNNYDYQTYTYLWWPMEDYRQIGWNAILGDPNAPEGVARRGLGNPDVRQSLWDIWFYRDFENYDQTFGKTHEVGQWPLRDELRLYLRNDVLAQLWDYGISPVSFEPVVEPFAEGELTVLSAPVVHAPGFPGAAPGELLAARNMAVGPDGNLYVLDSGNARVQVFTPEGELLTTWGEPGFEDGEFNSDGLGPWGIAVDDEFVYVADTWNHRVQKFTLAGEFVDSFGAAGDISQREDQGLGVFFGPRDIELTADGRLLITDTGNHRVQVFDTDGNALGQLGGSNGQFGGNLGFFYEPVGVASGPDGSIYVADTWNGRIQQFTPEFFPVNEWPVEEWIGNTSINNKPYLAVDSVGRVYVTDPEGFRVLVFGPNGDYLGKFGEFGTEPDRLALPTGIFIDDQDNVYVADAGNNRILRFDPVFASAFSPAIDEGEAPAAESDDAEAEDAAGDADTDSESDNSGDTLGDDGAEEDAAAEPTPTAEE